jgi:WD40 repeat protein
MPSLAADGSSVEVPSSPAPSPSRVGSSGVQPLQKLIDLTGHVGRAKGVVWNTQEGERSVASMDSQCLRIWQLNEAASQLTSPTAIISSAVEDGPNAAAWDPHHASLLASADGRHLRTWDLRAGSDATSRAAAPTLSIECAHEDLVRCIDYNPNRPFHLLSSSQDRRVHVWDLRSPAQPLQTLLSHSHWVLHARYNTFHDQLMLSAGTERVCLWSLGSTSSAPVGEIEQNAQGSAESQLEAIGVLLVLHMIL